MSLRFHTHTIMAGAAVLVSAASVVALAAPSASAAADQASGLSMSIAITQEGVTGDVCQAYANFNVTITNSTGSPVTVTSVDAGSYAPLSRDGGLAASTVLQPGTNTFTNLLTGGGPDEGPPCPQAQAPNPLVLTVNTAGGSVIWNQSVSDSQVVTEPQPSGINDMVGSFDVANCAEYYFQYGPTTAYGQQSTIFTTGCPNDGTMTQFAYYTPPGLAPGTALNDRLVVIETDGTALYGQNQGFYTAGGTPLAVGAVGGLGLVALAGCALFITQRRRRNRRSAPSSEAVNP